MLNDKWKSVIITVGNATMFVDLHFIQEFKKADIDNNLSISKAELGTLMKNMGMPADANSISKVFAEIDANRDGTVSWEEFSESFAKNILRVKDI